MVGLSMLYKNYRIKNVTPTVTEYRYHWHSMRKSIDVAKCFVPIIYC